MRMRYRNPITEKSLTFQSMSAVLELSNRRWYKNLKYILAHTRYNILKMEAHGMMEAHEAFLDSLDNSINVYR